MNQEKIKELCIKLKKDGMMPAEIRDHLLEKYNINVARNKIKSITRNVRGSTERKPKYKFSDGIYIVYYGKNKSISVREDELQKAFSLYCVADMTLNEVALSMKWTRDEFYAIKTAFSITKDSLPFTPEQIDHLTSDEIAEKTRIEKKRHALQKYQDSKYQDIKREVDKFNKSDYWYKELASQINAIDPSPYPNPRNHKNLTREPLLIITDIHAGLNINSPWNVYNFNIMQQRFKTLAQEIIATVKPTRLTIAELGDSIHGIIKGSIKKYSEPAVDSIFQVTEEIASLFITLIKAGFTIRFTKVNGNHSSIEKAKEDRTDEESFGRIIYWGLKLKFQNFKQIEFVDPVYNMSLLKFFDYGVLCCHGHQGDIKRLSEMDKFWKSENIIEVQAGHLHHRKIEEFNNITVHYNECFCGADQYAISKILGSTAGCRLVEYDKRGRIAERFIKL